MMNDKMCKCPHHSLVPLFAIAFGILFLLGDYGAVSWNAVQLTWPMLLIVGGLAKMMSRSCSCCKSMH